MARRTYFTNVVNHYYPVQPSRFRVIASGAVVPESGEPVDPENRVLICDVSGFYDPATVVGAALRTERAAQAVFPEWAVPGTLKVELFIS